MKKFRKYLKEHAAKIINYEKKEMIPLRIEKNKSYHNQKVRHICKKEFSIDYDDKNITKSHIIVIIVENIKVLLIIFVI